MKIFNIVAILSLLLLSHLASAHSGLKHSTPENGAVLNKAPEDLQLEFTMQVQLIRLQLMGKYGKPIKLATKPSNNSGTKFSIALPMLDTGSYKVTWLAMGKDAHKMKGDFTFTLHGSDMKKMPASADSHNSYD